ncbi:hypothetical protein HOB36_09770 [Candidatus Bathyarchaeota archaeon]|nr:hypothetical protein [Candidatus Bathyarchaeota archaeon]
MRSRRAVGSLIGIGFLLMILAVGFSFYEVVNRIERSSDGILLEMAALDRTAADEDLDIQRVRLTGSNSLNLTIKNTGDILAKLEWIGVFDDTSNTQDYYRVVASLNPTEIQTDIGNATIVMNPLNEYTIQVLTKLGNIYYGEYPEPVVSGSSGSGGNVTGPYYSDYEEADLHANTTVGTHTLFGAMKAGPDSIVNQITESSDVPSLVYDYIDNISDVDGSPDKGSHSDFNLQKANDGIYDTLTEEDSVTVSGITLVDSATYSVSTATVAVAKADFTGLANGDFVLIHYSKDNDLAWTTIATGFTKVDELLTTTGKDLTSGYFYKLMTDVSSEPSTWVFGNGSPKTTAVVATAWRGVDTGGYLDASATTTSGSNDGQPDSPDITTSNNDAMIIVSYHAADPGNIADFVGVAPSGFATNGYVSAYGGGPPNSAMMAVGYLEKASAGLETINSWQNTGSLSATEWHARVFSLVPATNTVNYELDLEVQFTSVNTGYDNTVIAIRVGTMGAEDLGVSIYNSSWYPIFSDLTTGWNNYTITGEAGLTETMTLRFLGGTESSDTTEDTWEIDAVLLSQRVSPVYYELDLEVLWSGLPSFANEYLMVYGETQGVEDLQLEVWDGGQWVIVVADIQAGWNAVDVSTYLTGSSFNIRFKDTLQVGDSTQENWEIDTLVLNLFD